MTFGDMLTDLKYRCTLENRSFPDSVLKTWMNAGYQNTGRRHLWPFLWTETDITTSASDDTYDIDDDVMFVYMVRNTTDDIPLNYVSLVDFFRTYPDPSATGTPSLFRLPGVTQSSVATTPITQIAFYPIPDGTKTIKASYYQRLTALDSNTDIPKIPTEYHELPILYAANIYFEREGDARAASMWDKYENGLKDMVEQYNAQPVDSINVLGSIDELTASPPVARFPTNFPNVRW